MAAKSGLGAVKGQGVNRAQNRVKERIAHFESLSSKGTKASIDFSKIARRNKICFTNLHLSKQLGLAGCKQLAWMNQYGKAQKRSPVSDMQLLAPTQAEVVLTGPVYSPYPNLAIQLGIVGAFTTVWAQRTDTIDELAKLQIALFVRSLLRDALDASSGKNKTLLWRLANIGGSATTDRLGAMSILAGYAHTADFRAAFKNAEKLSGHQIDPLSYFLSWAPIDVSIRKKILPGLVTNMTGTRNALSTGIDFHSWFPAIYRERTRQYGDFVSAEGRESDVADYEDFKRMYKIADPTMSSLMDKAITECLLIYPEIMEEIKKIMEEARMSIAIQASKGRFSEVA